MSIYNEVGQRAEVVTPHDTNALGGQTIGLWVGGAGNIRVKMAASNHSGVQDVLFSGVAAGTLLPLSVTQVFSTNTTATLIVALYAA